jgi:tRNA pseudouridine55 synthase
LEIEVRCGKGTYIRSLARDLGERLGCGGLVETLRRTRVGPFTADEALVLDVEATEVRKSLLPLSAAVPDLVRVSMDEANLGRLRHGLPVPADGVEAPEEEDVAVFDARGELVALARLDRKNGLLRPEKVIAV